MGYAEDLSNWTVFDPSRDRHATRDWGLTWQGHVQRDCAFWSRQEAEAAARRRAAAFGCNLSDYRVTDARGNEYQVQAN